MSGKTTPLITQAKWHLPQRVFYWAEKMNVAPTSVVVRDTRSRWGSCSAKGRIMLCWRLILMPEGVRDSIVIHELGHLRHFDHSRDFWNFVDAHDPHRRVHQLWLKRNARDLLLQ